MYCNIVYATGEINHPPLRTIESYKYPLGIESYKYPVWSTGCTSRGVTRNNSQTFPAWGFHKMVLFAGTAYFTVRGDPVTSRTATPANIKF